MKNRLIASIGLLVVFVINIIPPNSFSMGQVLMIAPGFLATLYGILNFAVFFASIAGVVIFITLLIKKSIIPVIVDWIAVGIVLLFVVFRFIYGGFSTLYLPTTYLYIACAVLSAFFMMKYKKSGE